MSGVHFLVNRTIANSAGKRLAPRRQNISRGSRSIQVGFWELMETCGHGSHADVFFARPANAADGTTADYALKRLAPRRWRDEQAVAMFRREAACGSSSKHPNLATTLVANVDQPPYFFVMPRLKGATVRQVLSAGETFSPARSIWIVRQIAEGLRSLHENGWLHGDIKPSNIMTGFNGHATLFDFGFARKISDVAGTDQEPFCGTLRYTAPESLTSTRRMSNASDVYSLGITLFEMLTGQPPFTCCRPESLAESHLKIPAPSVRTARPDLPRCVSQAVASMLAKDPMRRPNSLSELSELLIQLEVETFAIRDSAA